MNDKEKIEKLDLSKIKWKLEQPIELGGQRWSKSKCNSVEQKYKEFLKLVLSPNSETTEPIEDVDTMWHTHILDTPKYFADCMDIFGEYIHHMPSYANSSFCNFSCSGSRCRRVVITTNAKAEKAISLV